MLRTAMGLTRVGQVWGPHVKFKLGADYMDRASPVNRAEKCHENLHWAAK